MGAGVRGVVDREQAFGFDCGVPLRRRQIAMSGELLDSPRRRATHRQVRTEGVTEYVNTSALEIRHPRGAAHMIRNDLRRHECPIRLTEHAR